MRVAFDTNILVYCEGVDHAVGDRVKIDVSRGLLSSLHASGHHLVFPAQALAELFRVLLRRGRRTSMEARAAVHTFASLGDVVPSSQSVLSAAMDLTVRHGLQIFDAVIMAAAADAGCELLISEDLQSGFRWHGVAIATPFANIAHPRLAPFLP